MRKLVFAAFLLALLLQFHSAHAQSLSANGTITGATTIITGDATVFTGNCTAILFAADVEIRIMDNRTGAFTNSTFDASADVFVNATNYTIGTLAGNSAGYLFLINATRPGFYNFSAQCEASSSTVPEMANSSSTPSILTANQAYGHISTVLERPFNDSTATITQNDTFVLRANATCMSGNPTAICGVVNGSARYNYTEDGNQINTTLGDVPLWTVTGNQTCGLLNDTDTCVLNWTVNATGPIGSNWNVSVLFSSEDSNVEGNNTRNATVSIVGCFIDFTLHWADIDFGNIPPSTLGNDAPGNTDDIYNVSVNSNSCDLDLYVRGTDLINDTLTTIIGTGNISWSSGINDYSVSTHLSSAFMLMNSSVAADTNLTTWYWLDLPAVFAGIYTGNIFIAGVISGNQL